MERPIERQTLMQAVEILDRRLTQLNELSGLTERLNEKLQRTGGHPLPDDKMKEKESPINMNIVELFYMISEKMETQINIIGMNTEKSMQMID